MPDPKGVSRGLSHDQFFLICQYLQLVELRSAATHQFVALKFAQTQEEHDSRLESYNQLLQQRQKKRDFVWELLGEYEAKFKYKDHLE